MARKSGAPSPDPRPPVSPPVSAFSAPVMQMLVRSWVVLALCAGVAWKLQPGGIKQDIPVFGRFLAELLMAGPHVVANWARGMGGLLLGAALLLLYDSCGLRILRWVLGRRPAGVVRLAAVPLAYCLMAFVLLGAAETGLWWPSILTGLLAFMFLFGLPELPRSARDAAGTVVNALKNSPPVMRIILLVVAAWWLVFILPPEVNQDCLEYNFSYPMQVLNTHRLFGTQVYMAWLYPLIVEFPHIFALYLGADIPPRLLISAIVCLGALAMIRSFPFRLGPALEAAGVLTTLGAHESIWTMVTGKNDMAVAGYGLLGIALLLSSGALQKGRRDTATMFVGAWMLGVFGASKFVLFPVSFLLGAASLLFLRRNRLRTALLLAVVLSTPIMPWVAKNMVYANDPQFPVGTMVLPKFLGNPQTNNQVIQEFKYNLMLERGSPWAFAHESLMVAVPSGFILIAALPYLLYRAVPGAWMMFGTTFLGLCALIILVRLDLVFVGRYMLAIPVAWNMLGFCLLFAQRRGNPPAPPPADTPAPDAEKPPPFGPRWLVTVTAVAALLGIVRATNPHRYLHPTAYAVGKYSTATYITKGMPAYGGILAAFREAAAKTPVGSRVITYAEPIAWGVPRRFLNESMGPHPIWQAVMDSADLTRLQIKFRQMNARLLVYNVIKAIWAQSWCSPYSWTPRMLRLYADFAARHLRPIKTSDREYPMFGLDWLYEILPEPAPPLKRMVFLPGADRALCVSKRAETIGDFAKSADALQAIREIIPEFSFLDAQYGYLLMCMGNLKPAYALLIKSINEGVTYNYELIHAAEAALMLGRGDDFMQLYSKAAFDFAYYPQHLELLRKVSRIPEAAFPPLQTGDF